MPKYKEVELEKLIHKGYELVVHSSGTKEWRLDGYMYREDGPAYEGIRNNKEWWLNGEQLDKEWFLENPEKIAEMKAWELFTPEELVTRAK